jgi:MFS family permease
MQGYLGFIRQQWAILAFGFLAVFWGNFGQTFFVGLFSAPIQDSLDLSASAYGSAYSLATLASALTVVWAGSLIDSINLKVYTAVICLGLAAAGLVLSQSYNLAVLTLGFFLLRLFGQALLPHTGATTMARTFESNRGKALSLSSSAFPVGEIILPFTAVMLIAALGWRGTYLCIAILVIIFVLPLMQILIRFAGLQVAQAGATAAANKQRQAGVRTALLSDKRYWLALPGLMAGPFIATGVFIHQDFVIQSKDWTPAWFATCFAVYGAVHWLSSLVSGILVDRFTAVKLLPFYLLPMSLSLLVLSFFSGTWLALVFMSLLAMSIGSTPPISGSLWPEIYGVHNLGTVRSLNIAIMVFATALSPALYGIGIDYGISLEWISGLSAIYVLGASGLMGLSYFKHSHKHAIADKSAVESGRKS